MDNTINDSKKRAPSLKETGESGDLEESVELNDASSPATPQISEAVRDQNGNYWLQVSYRGKSQWFKLIEFVGGAKSVLSKFAESHGVLMSYAQAKRLADKARGVLQYERRFVADRPGWIDGCYVFGDGTVCTHSGGGNNLLVIFPPMPKFGAAGTTKEWTIAVAPLIENQPAALVALSLAFLPPLLDVVRGTPLEAANPVVEVVGESSKGKSTLFIRLAGSVWGYADRPTGFCESWYMTKSGAEPLIATHHCSLLGLDEVLLAGDTEEEVARTVAAAVHIIANGTDKATKTNGISQISSQVVCLSSSNHRLVDILRAKAASKRAMEARLISITPPVHPDYGIFAHVPKDFEDSAAMVGKVNEVTAQYYGAPIRQFISALVEARHSNADKLQTDIGRYVYKFMTAINLDRTDSLAHRRAKVFGLAYAASQLARRWKALPDSDTVGNYKEAFKAAWSWTRISTDGPSVSAADTLKAYVKNNRKAFTRVVEPKKMSDEAFAKCPGFVKKTRDGRRELVMACAKFRKQFKFDRKAVAELLASGFLVGERGATSRSDTKRKIRCNGDGEVVSDRVYVIRPDALGVDLVSKKGIKK